MCSLLAKMPNLKQVIEAILKKPIQIILCCKKLGTTGNFVRNDSLSNIFTYNENVHAFYSQYGNKFGDFSFLLGLRLENTQMKGKVDAENVSEDEPFDLNFDKNYTGLFPTVNLTYELKENENITLGYNRRINRPRNWYINPFPSRSSEANVFQGNPDLDPAYASAFDLGYLKRWKKLTLSVLFTINTKQMLLKEFRKKQAK